MKKEFQLGLLVSKEENLNEAEQFDKNFLLPNSPLQQKLAVENPVLTEREFAIMEMTLTGASIEEIAVKIFLSVAGVKWRLSHIYNKFGVINRLALIKKSAKEGLQFRSEEGILHTFHNKLDLRGFNKAANG